MSGDNRKTKMMRITKEKFEIVALYAKRGHRTSREQIDLIVDEYDIIRKINVHAK